jgi:hypothetical protein
MIGANSAITALYGGNAAACDFMLARRKLQIQHAAEFAQLENYYDRASGALPHHAVRMTTAELQAIALCGGNVAARVFVPAHCKLQSSNATTVAQRKH